MKLLVLSDTHGSLNAVESILRLHSDADKILHLGDYYRDGQRIGALAGKEVIGVKGNMDLGYSREDYLVLETEYGRILLTHGHMESVKNDLQNLYYAAAQQECRAVLFGHTHIPLFEECRGLYLFNPGSLSRPMPGRRGTYGVVVTTEEDFLATIYEVPQDTPTSSPASGGGAGGMGRIRDILNNSDRA